MLSLLILACALSAVVWTAAGYETDGSLTADRYSTHDGEFRSVPGVQGKRSSEFKIMEIVFIALPGEGNESIELTVSFNNTRLNITLRDANNSFGEFGYTLSVSNEMSFTWGDNLTICHPVHEDSALRLLHQVGDQSRNICWSKIDNPDEITCRPDYHYPLLAIETDPEGCIEGLLNASELRREWENRDPPLLYSSPEIHLLLSCTGLLFQVLAGVYPIPGDPTEDVVVQITSLRDSNSCNVSSLPWPCLNTYNCMNISVKGNSSLQVFQRYSTSQIGFVHNEGIDTPLLSVNISGGCNSSNFMSKDVLRIWAEELGLCIPLSPTTISSTFSTNTMFRDNSPSICSSMPPMECNSNSTELLAEKIIAIAILGTATGLFLLITVNIACCLLCLIVRQKGKKKRDPESSVLTSTNTKAINTHEDPETLPNTEQQPLSHSPAPSGDSAVVDMSMNEAYLTNGMTLTSNPAYEPLQRGTSGPEESLMSYSYVYAEAL